MAEKKKEETRYGSARIDLDNVLTDLEKSPDNKEEEEGKKGFFEMIRNDMKRGEKEKDKEEKEKEEEVKQTPPEEGGREGGRGGGREGKDMGKVAEREQKAAAVENEKLDDLTSVMVNLPEDELVKALMAAASENKQASENINKLIKTLKDASREDPLFDLIKEIARSIIERLDQMNENVVLMGRHMGNLQSRLDTMLGIEEKSHLKGLEGDLKKVALELELLPVGETISIDVVASRTGLEKEEIRDAIKRLAGMGWNLEVVEDTEKILGIVSKKVVNIIKR
jgi:hypothetical protein